MLTGAEDIIVLSRPFSISCTTSHKTCHKLYDKRHPNIRVPLNARSVGLAGQPGIPPTAAPPEASYRRPEDNIVLSRPPSIPCTTSHKTCHKLYDKRHPNIRVPLNVRSMGSARQTGHTPHSRTSATPSPQRIKILTKRLVRQSCSRVQRTILFYLTHTGYHALLHIKHATNSTTKGTPYRVPSGQDPWVWPDNPAYPPWPHLRYPLTSKDEDPNNKKLLGRVAHECRGHYCFICSTIIPHRKPI